MGKIDRRQLLAGLCIGSVSGDFARVDTTHAMVSAVGARPSDDQGAWFIARERLRTSEQYVVEFWTSPACKIEYADQLPPNIVRAAIWHECDVHRNSLNKLCWLRSDPEILQFSGLSALAQWLHANAGIAPHRVRKTALVALGGVSSGQPARPSWSDVLPAFRHGYEHLIGHLHIEQRGFVHWKAELCDEQANASGFEKAFTELTSQLDAVIFTSQSLIENDAYLSARASTEVLLGELVGRLGDALLDEQVVANIVMQEKLRPQTFALGSAGASANSPILVLADLLRQRELVFSSFGKPLLQPMLIATRTNAHCAEIVENQIAGSNIKFMKTLWASQNYENASAGWSEFTTLWPFDPNYGPWP